MHTTAKTSRATKPKATTVRSRARKPAAKRALPKAVPTAEDLAAREKIGKTLDLAAFIAFHRKNSAASARYWESKEYSLSSR
jgi:hypothetical protein